MKREGVPLTALASVMITNAKVDKANTAEEKTDYSHSLLKMLLSQDLFLDLCLVQKSLKFGGWGVIEKVGKVNIKDEKSEDFLLAFLTSFLF